MKLEDPIDKLHSCLGCFPQWGDGGEGRRYIAKHQHLVSGKNPNLAGFHHSTSSTRSISNTPKPSHIHSADTTWNCLVSVCGPRELLIQVSLKSREGCISDINSTHAPNCVDMRHLWAMGWVLARWTAMPKHTWQKRQSEEKVWKTDTFTIFIHICHQYGKKLWSRADTVHSD